MNQHVEAIPALNDNYIWALVQGSNCVLVDPGEPGPALEFLEAGQLNLTGLLLTHHHPDHIGGVAGIRDRHPAPAWGPDDERMPADMETVGEGDSIALPGLDTELKVMETPGHTRSHIVFHGQGMLFSGDTLFSAGCGRLFEGTPEQMQASMDKLAGLPDETRFYCGHEYTESNCRFALQVEPDNPALRQRMNQVRELRSQDRMTLPDTLGRDRQVNPFFRTREPSVIEAARGREEMPDERPATVFGVIRRWKDRF